jgi:Tfp pilus assembly protein PilO
MKKYFAQLRPMERRLVVGVGVVLLLVLNAVFIWPHFSDWGNLRGRIDGARVKLKTYREMVAQTPALKADVDKFERAGEFVAPEDQGINFMRVIQSQSMQSGVQLQNTSRQITRTGDAFFVEQVENIHVIGTEEQLVDFLYNLGSGASMIRVRDLTLQPDPPHQRLSADIRLVASYQKNPTSAAKIPTAKAK